jgi:hypothetical protein
MKRVYKLFILLAGLATPSISYAADSIYLKQSGGAVLSPKELAAKALPYAKISAAVYDNKSVGDWKIVDSWKSLIGGGLSGFLEKTKGVLNGFNAQVYKNSKTEQIVVAFEGTNPLNPADWINNVGNGIGLPMAQYDYAVKVTELAMQKYKDKDIIVTGHSLGGGLAQYAASKLNVNAVTFNAAGLSWLKSGLMLGDRVLNINASGDKVSNIWTTQQTGTEYRLESEVSGVLKNHDMDTIISILKKEKNAKENGTHVNWAAVSFARGNMAAIISGNVSATGSAGGSTFTGSKTEVVSGGLFVSYSPLAATEWVLTKGNPSLHLGQGTSFGPITAPSGGIIYSLNNSGVASTSIEKEFVVGSKSATINVSGLANFVTTEYPKYVGTQYNDTTSITITTQSGKSATLTSKQLFAASVNGSNLSGVSGLPVPLAGWNTNNVGGQTGFKDFKINNMKLAPGSTVKIKVNVTNVGDTQYPSATLLNKVEAK